ncbi:MAG TPA: membrane protein insertase YidC, partial [Stellaceae bacterium]|nr:membrane protein insertase YidC [Stellaceae bacterium]
MDQRNLLLAIALSVGILIGLPMLFAKLHLVTPTPVPAPSTATASSTATPSAATPGTPAADQPPATAQGGAATPMPETR